jgi:hypothetical protein
MSAYGGNATPHGGGYGGAPGYPPPPQAGYGMPPPQPGYGGPPRPASGMNPERA